MLIFAKNAEGRIVSVDEVANGLACQCTCPECGNPLVARNGGHVQVHHFAHADGSDCPHANESALHLLYKQRIQDAMEITLPAYKSIPARTVRFDEVQLEVPFADGHRADVVGYRHGRALYIEIKVTHAVDESKLQAIKEAELSCIEIDAITGETHWLNAPVLQATIERKRQEEQQRQKQQQDAWVGRMVANNGGREVKRYDCRMCELVPRKSGMGYCPYRRVIYYPPTDFTLLLCMYHKHD